MTDRPRTWTIEGWDHNTMSHGRITDGKRLNQGEQVRVVELDRGRVVPIIERTLMDHERSTDYRLTAEDVFDEIIGGDET